MKSESGASLTTDNKLNVAPFSLQSERGNTVRMPAYLWDSNATWIGLHHPGNLLQLPEQPSFRIQDLYA